MQGMKRENQKGKQRERGEETQVPEPADPERMKQNCKGPLSKSASRPLVWSSAALGTFMLVDLRSYRCSYLPRWEVGTNLSS